MVPEGLTIDNVDLWSHLNAELTNPEAAELWASDEFTWGLFGVPERKVSLLGDVSGRDVLELGCGTGHLSAWLARRGAHPIGLDSSRAQLATARRCQRTFAIDFPLVEGDAEHLPLAASRFDLVVSEYGAAPWCAPERWLAEAARVLRPGGTLVFLTNSLLAALCVPSEGGFAGDRLLRDSRDVRRITWPGGGTEHHPGHGEWIHHLRSAGFAVEALHELRAPGGTKGRERYEIVTREWATHWAAEDVWVARVADEPPTSRDPIRPSRSRPGCCASSGTAAIAWPSTSGGRSHLRDGAI